MTINLNRLLRGWTAKTPHLRSTFTSRLRRRPTFPPWAGRRKAGQANLEPDDFVAKTVASSWLLGADLSIESSSESTTSTQRAAHPSPSFAFAQGRRRMPASALKISQMSWHRGQIHQSYNPKAIVRSPQDGRMPHPPIFDYNAP